MSAAAPGEARRLLERELAHREYRGPQETWWDRASRSFLDWLGSLAPDGVGSPGFGRTLLVIAIVVLVAVVVLVVVTRGLPRRRARSRPTALGGVFDDDDLRSAQAVSAAAQAAFRAGDWATAVLEGYRALARGLGERDLVRIVPGATARAIADRATVPFPQLGTTLRGASDTFDAVRYLGADADESAARRVLETERAVREARPAHADRPAVPA
ncbi:DUF4129 domain-containing protein [Curtobacterium herbarum]|uniref:Protein-glutamine gamma-glutamyltransferase-like C-terminal domain-containing protein n=1 Tax=Curtobacterium herbarum TaxID=150122 RepID=A0ABP4KBD4_9MICO|nr:DUF4129 domain-containing protein [Curtobacterium herbarum]MBM7475029.1 hypothetical protein [Curtobacterium herbarum]MCS6545672.1 DUF4129 domain-containing protein [Curtobacterium herbarum]